MWIFSLFFGGNRVRTFKIALSTTMFVVDRISVKVCNTYERSYSEYVLSGRASFGYSTLASEEKGSEK